MKRKFLNIGIPIFLLIVAVFIIGPACSGDPTYRYYPDDDGDGFGAWNSNPVEAYLNAEPQGYVRDKTDCNDTNSAIYPGATELPDNLIDEDCNGQIAFTFYADKDDDGFGNPNSTVILEIDDYNSDAPNGYSWFAGDCDDNNNAVNPLADEILENGIDDNCDGETDIKEYYIDADGDGYGSNQLSAAQGVNNNLDCDDTNAEIHPFNKEIIDNGIDDDCDGNIDEIN